MNKHNFTIWMNSISDKYLEEAARPAKKRRYHPLALVAAACLVLAATGLISLQGRLQNNSKLPDILEFLPNEEGITQHAFTKDGTTYTMLTCLSEKPTDISGITAATESLSWYAAGLEIKLCSTNDTIWASWYDTSTCTQWCLVSAQTSSLSLLTTAKDIVEELGYNVAVAPEGATDVTYDAFLINNLTVAETTFVLDGILYSYRMAATYEISTDFADISGTGDLFDNHCTAEVGWCSAKLYFNENSSGKIIWFDIAPGLLYSLSMENCASEEALLSMAHDLFAPAQDQADW